jgi:hypothetical protein
MRRGPFDLKRARMTLSKGFAYITGLGVFAFVFGVYYLGLLWPTPSTRDAQRRQNMQELGRALAAYFGDYSAYPPIPASTDCMSLYNNLGGLENILVPKYIKIIPKDPMPKSCLYNYRYLSDVHSYVVLINMETLDRTEYNDNWCIGASDGTLPPGLNYDKPCP